MSSKLSFRAAILISVVSVSTALGQFAIDWNTIDCGGTMSSSGGPFTLAGTIGQHDAGSPSQPLSGGGFQLVGGFWAISSVAGCVCQGDLNGDSTRNGGDVQQFVTCLIQGSTCTCGDMDGSASVTVGDVPLFVAALLSGASCS